MLALFIIHGGLAQSCAATMQAVRRYQDFVADGGLGVLQSLVPGVSEVQSEVQVKCFYTSDKRNHDEVLLAQWLTDILADSDKVGVPNLAPIPCFVFGGDGTLNLVVQEIHRGGYQQQLALVPVPLGTGNDAARRLKIRSWLWLLRNETPTLTELRYGQIADRIFINSVGIGLSADLVAAQSSRLKRYFGSLSYTVAALKWLLKPRVKQLKINAKPSVIMLFSVGVGKYCGGGIRLHPHAEQALAENKLSVVRIGKLPRYLHPWYLFNVLCGRHTRRAAVDESFAGSLLLQSSEVEPIAVEVDGDLLTQLAMDVAVEIVLATPSIQVYVPAATAKQELSI